MQQINVLHLINAFEESSIGSIIMRLVTYLGQEDYGWHIGALSNSGNLQAKFIHSGAEVMDFSNTGKNQQSIKEYVLTHQIRIIHTHTPHTILKVASSLSPGIMHLTTRHLLASPSDRRLGIRICFMGPIQPLPARPYRCCEQGNVLPYSLPARDG